MGLCTVLLLAALGAQDPAGEALPDPEDVFTSSLSAWLGCTTRFGWPGLETAGDADVQLRRRWQTLLGSARTLGVAALLAEPTRLRQLVEPALVGANQELGEGAHPTGALDPWVWLSPQPPGQNLGYRVVVRLVQDQDLLRRHDDARPFVLEPWPNLGVLGGVAVVALRLPLGFEFQDPLWNETEAGREREAARVAATERALREALARVPRWDPNRLVLDCDRGTCAFGLRLLTYWPQRFAGALLREPELVPGLRLDAVACPVGLVAEFLTREATDELQLRLEDHSGRRDGPPRFLARPFEGFEGRISEAELPAYERWFEGLEREPEVRTTIVATPLGWRGPGTGKVSVEGLTERPDAEARAEVAFDRTRNRVTVVTRGVRAITVWLDDRSVDLDAPVTFVLDGTTIVERFVRDLGTVLQRCALTWDPTDLASARITLALPRRE